MTLLKDLMALRAGQQKVVEKQIDEARREGDLSDLIEKWMDQNKIYHFEGSRGERNFGKLIGVLGYNDMSAFLEDNPGVFQAMIEWIGTMRNPDWIESFQNEVGDDEDDDDEDDDK